MTLIAHFKCESMPDCRTEVPSIAHVKEGFWVNRYLEFTKGCDGKFWIPPSSVTYVEKIGEV